MGGILGTSLLSTLGWKFLEEHFTSFSYIPGASPMTEWVKNLPAMHPSGDPGVSGDFWGSQEGCQGPSRPSGRLREGSVTFPGKGPVPPENSTDRGTWWVTVRGVAKESDTT